MSAFRDVVARNHRRSQAFLVAAREPCVAIAMDEQRNGRGRLFRVVEPADVPAVRLRRSWIMAILLCPGDATSEVASWFAAHRLDTRRAIFYLHPKPKPRRALAAWQEAGLPVHSTWPIDDWTALHRHFGSAWNVRIYDDFR